MQDERITITLPKDKKEELRKFLEDRGMTFASMLRIAVKKQFGFDI